MKKLFVFSQSFIPSQFRLKFIFFLRFYLNDKPRETISSVWPDGVIIFQYLAISNNENVPDFLKQTQHFAK